MSCLKTRMLEAATRISNGLITLGSGSILQYIARYDAAWGGTGYAVPVADSFCIRGDIERGCSIIERNITHMLTTDTWRKHTPPPAPPTIPVTDRIQCLADVLQALGPLGCRPFLAFGSLLGFVREGGFIQHDRDVDIGLMTDEVTCLQVCKALDRAGFTLSLYEGPEWPCRVQCFHTNRTLVDVVFFKPCGRHVLTYTRCLGHLIIRERTPFTLEESSFYDRTVWVPENPTVFLEENYGDWRTPSNYHHHILSSRLTDFSTLIVRYITRKAFYLLIRKGAVQQAFSVLDIARDKYPEDLFWSEVARHLHAGTHQ